MIKTIVALTLLLLQAFPFPGGHTANAGGGGSVIRVQSKPGANGFGGTTVTTAFTSNTGAGHIVAVCAEWATNVGGNSGITASFSDTQALTYTTVVATRKTVATTHSAEIGTECGYSTTTTSAAADTVTCTFSLATGANYCYIVELSGQNASPLDQSNIGTGTSTTPSAGSITPSVSNTFGIVIAAQDDGVGVGGAGTAGSGWTIDQNSGGGNFEYVTEYQAIASGTVTGNFTMSNTGQWVASVISFKP